MKVALVHDYIKEYGGAERVLEALHEIYPDSPVYTLVYLPEFLGPHKGRFKNWKIRTSFLQYIPFKEKLISPFRLLAPFVFKTFDFSEFDIVIVSATGAYSPNIISNIKYQISNIPIRQAQGGQVRHDKSRKPVHICYCHTPPRYLYGYATAREWKKNLILRSIGEIANHFLRLVDYRSAQNVDYFIANSEEVRGRIKKFYRKNATVIYPPVDMQLIGDRKTYTYNLKPKTYYVAGGRLARPKHIDLIIEAFQKLNRPLKIFGRGFAGYEKELGIRNQESGEDNIHNSSFIIPDSKTEFVGEITDQEKWELMRGAKAYIFASEEEDFGITPVEAMAEGTPVIAYRSGGVQESIIDGKTGVFFDKLNVESVLAAIKRFDTIKIRPEDCIKQAIRFSKQRFEKEIKEFIKKIK